MSEKRVQADIKDALKGLGGMEWQKDYEHLPMGFYRAPFWIYDFSQPRRSMQTPGIADLLLVGFGRSTWVEVKEHGSQSKAQVHFERIVKENGSEYLVWTSPTQAVAWFQARREERRGGRAST